MADPFADFGEPEPLAHLAADFLAGMAEPEPPEPTAQTEPVAYSDARPDAFSAPVGALVDPDAQTAVRFPVVVQGVDSIALGALYEPSRRVAEIIEALEPVLAPPPVVADLEALVLKANGLVVTDAATYQTGCELYELLAANEKGIEETIGPVVGFFHRPWKALCQFRARFAKPVEEAKTRLSDVCGAWKLADDLRVERERRLAEDKAAADERARLQAIADAAKELGDVLTVEAAVEAKAAVVPPVLPRQAFAPAVPTTGTKSRTPYEAVITDEEKFYKALADGTIPRCAVLIDQSYLNRQANDLKEEMGKRFPGVEARKKGGLTAAGSARRR